MKILFLTIVKIEDISERGIYTDLLRKFKKEGHDITIVSPFERREKQKTRLIKKNGITTLKVKTFNLQKVNVFEKGIGTILIEYQFLSAIKKYLNEIKFDLILYSTPPITFTKIVKYIKNRDGAYSYLLLKDIFPQNAVDMGMIKKNGPIHRFFKQKEKSLYNISDTIGCMSKANQDYIIKNNQYLDPSKIEVNPNSIDSIEIKIDEGKIVNIKNKFKIPLNKKIFIYGGNLGKPQGIDFLLETIQKSTNENAYFLIVGSGTEFFRIKKWFENHQPQNALLLAGLPKKEYEELLLIGDVGLIFLHKDFTIPNFPSRLLSYLEMRMPVIAATDICSDIGLVIEKANCGYWVETGNLNKINEVIGYFCENKMIDESMKNNALNLLKKEYTVEISYKLIFEKIL